jgi:hypothetical protein
MDTPTIDIISELNYFDKFFNIKEQQARLLTHKREEFVKFSDKLKVIKDHFNKKVDSYLERIECISKLDDFTEIEINGLPVTLDKHCDEKYIDNLKDKINIHTSSETNEKLIEYSDSIEYIKDRSKIDKDAFYYGTNTSVRTKFGNSKKIMNDICLALLSKYGSRIIFASMLPSEIKSSTIGKPTETIVIDLANDSIADPANQVAEFFNTKTVSGSFVVFDDNYYASTDKFYFNITEL